MDWSRSWILVDNVRLPRERAGSSANRVGSLAKRTRAAAKRAGSLTKRAGFLAKRAGSLTKRAGFLAKRAGSLTKRAGFLAKRAGSLTKRAGSHSKRAGSTSIAQLTSPRTKNQRENWHLPVLPLVFIFNHPRNTAPDFSFNAESTLS
ncbi:hypothetical protein [Sporosarcina gallistercoris]|uniref:Uncharacterized protein n=1 Tax=Sporosarcina gallistercoris TaxID=2762245 RepID=A0ABR8PIK8_9BACL|nr:hypothetical protein [Sporosarcina gallistercoris]MBD7907990.1 hypothetical protein [Sporosarcina gallistercoris]